MISITRILCPVDQSPVSLRALEYAVQLARWYEARLRVIEVAALVLPPVGVAPADASPFAFTVQARRAMADELRAFVKPVDAAGVDVAFEIEQGDVVPCILRAAREWPADLIVMGTHGRGGFERFAVGSVAEKVLRKAPCPVATVPPHMAERPAGHSRTILCAVDFSPSSVRAAEFALSLAQESDARLLLLHVLEWPDGWERTLPELRREREAEARRLMAGLLPEEAAEWCRPDPIVAAGKASQEILRLAREHAADLIVLGVHGRTAVDLALFGSTAHAVLRESECPVLTVRS
ncbi:MAG: universal stress protein [Acidobacteriota bacterium]